MGSSSLFVRTTSGLALACALHACATGVDEPLPQAGAGALTNSGTGGSGGAGGAGGSTVPQAGSVATAGAGGSMPQAGSTAAAGAGANPSFAATVQPLFNQACNCHQSTPILMAPFSLKPGEAYANIVNVVSTQLPSMVFVKPGSTSTSYLWHKVAGTHLEVGGTGKIMPFTIPLNEGERAIVERWISGGANP
jgi:hypothetical protein